MTYGSVIKQAREDRRMTQEQLAEALDISRQAVSKWEADLSKPTREKLDRLTEILGIPPETWKAIAAEIEAANKPEDRSRPWKIATGVLSAACLALVIALIAALRTGPGQEPVDMEDGNAPEPVRVEAPGDLDYENTPIPDPEPEALPVIPEVIPLDVEHDYTFGDWRLGEYEPGLIPFLDDEEQVMEHELWVGWFPDGTRLGLVKCAASWDAEMEHFDAYIVWAPPVEQTGGVLDCHILVRIAEDYVMEESGDPVGEAFANVLGYSGLKLTLSAAENLYRHSSYFAQRNDGTICMITGTGGDSWEADVDEDGVLEIVYQEESPSSNRWVVIDDKDGEEGAFRYYLNDADWLSSDPYISGFDYSRKAFVTLDVTNTVLARYVLRNGEMVRVPETDFSVEDYLDVARTEIIFVTDAGGLSDGYGPDVILPYNPLVRITHRQQAYIALQELYNLTGLKVDRCYCAAGTYDVIFSLVPDGFNMRSFYSLCPNGSLGSYGEKTNIGSFHISWQELRNGWSPLVFADSVKAEGSSVEEKMKELYDRLSVVKTGEAAEIKTLPDPNVGPGGVYTGEIWLENGDLYNVFYQLVDGEPALCNLYGPYPDGIVNH